MNSEAVQPVLSPSGSSQMCCHLSKPAALLTYSVAFRQSVRWSMDRQLKHPILHFESRFIFRSCFFRCERLCLPLPRLGVNPCIRSTGKLDRTFGTDTPDKLRKPRWLASRYHDSRSVALRTFLISAVAFLILR